MWGRSPKLALSRRTLHYPRVDLDKHWNECGHDRPSWHYLGLPFTIQKWIWTNICKVDVLQSGIGPISGNVNLIGSGFGPKLTTWALSRVDLGQNLAKWALSGVDLVQNFAKWALSGPKSSQVGTIGGGGGPGVDLDALSKGESGRFLDTVDKIKGSSGQLTLLESNKLIGPNDPEHPIETFI